MLLSIRGLDFGYTPDNLLFRNIHLDIAKGKIVALIGESGCGKTTLLSIIYGLLEWQAGRIFFNDKEIFGPKTNIIPGEKKMKIVAQHYDLMPYSTVYDNVGKYITNIDLEEKKQKVSNLLQVVGLEDFADKLPKNLSGGQQQRVAIAQALSTSPELLLLDEPFSNLDFSRKSVLRERLFNFVKDKNISLIISTHEFQEVMPWVDEVFVLQEGRLIQRDTPKTLFAEPYNDYVARLLGEVNILSEEMVNRLGLKTKYYFPNEILAAEEGEYPAEVEESLFAGNFYRNKLKISDYHLINYTLQPISGNIKLNFIKMR